MATPLVSTDIGTRISLVSTDTGTRIPLISTDTGTVTPLVPTAIKPTDQGGFRLPADFAISSRFSPRYHPLAGQN